MPETRYARSGSINVAYQVVGDAPLDLVLVPGFVSHVELAWEQPNYARFLTRLAAFSRLIVFDKRGTGMSDPVDRPPTMNERMDDIRAVMEAVGSRQATLFGISEGGTLGVLFALAHPAMARSLILYGSWARRLRASDYPWGLDPRELDGFLARMADAWATGEWWRPTPEDDDRHRVWWARYLRTAASPAMAQNAIRMNSQIDLRAQLSRVTAPTLIMHRRRDQWIEVGHARYLAAHIRGAKLVELPGVDHRPWLGDADALLNEVELFVTGRKSRPKRRATLGPDALSQREREVAVLAARAETAPEIASRLSLSERTVETHLASVYGKLGVRSKGELVRRAEEFGL